MTLLVMILTAAVYFTVFYITQNKANKASEASLYGREGEVVAYAAALASLDENEGKSKTEMIEIAQAYLDARDALNENHSGSLEETDERQYQLELEYCIDDLPVLYYSLEEFEGGLEDRLVILGDFSYMYDDGNEPETKGYTREDFYRLCDERIAAEKEVLEKLKADDNLDLYTYSLMLYQARMAHKVVT
jgi:hypothetical protein